MSRMLVIISFAPAHFTVQAHRKNKINNKIIKKLQTKKTAQKTKDLNLGFVTLLNALRKFPKVDDITSP